MMPGGHDIGSSLSGHDRTAPFLNPPLPPPPSLPPPPPPSQAHNAPQWGGHSLSLPPVIPPPGASPVAGGAGGLASFGGVGQMKTVRERKLLIRDRLIHLLRSRDNRSLSFRSVGNDEKIKTWCKKLKLLYVIQSFPECFEVTKEESNCYFVRLKPDSIGGGPGGAGGAGGVSDVMTPLNTSASAATPIGGSSPRPPPPPPPLPLHPSAAGDLTSRSAAYMAASHSHTYHASLTPTPNSGRFAHHHHHHQHQQYGHGNGSLTTPAAGCYSSATLMGVGMGVGGYSSPHHVLMGLSAAVGDIPQWRTFRSLKKFIKWGSHVSNRDSVSVDNPVKVAGLVGIGREYEKDRIFDSYTAALTYLRKRRGLLTRLRRDIRAGLDLSHVLRTAALLSQVDSSDRLDLTQRHQHHHGAVPGAISTPSGVGGVMHGGVCGGVDGDEEVPEWLDWTGDDMDEEWRTPLRIDVDRNEIPPGLELVLQAIEHEFTADSDEDDSHIPVPVPIPPPPPTPPPPSQPPPPHQHYPHPIAVERHSSATTISSVASSTPPLLHDHKPPLQLPKLGGHPYPHTHTPMPTPKTPHTPFTPGTAAGCPSWLDSLWGGVGDRLDTLTEAGDWAADIHMDDSASCEPIPRGCQTATHATYVAHAYSHPPPPATPTPSKQPAYTPRALPPFVAEESIWTPGNSSLRHAARTPLSSPPPPGFEDAVPEETGSIDSEATSGSRGSRGMSMSMMGGGPAAADPLGMAREQLERERKRETEGTVGMDVLRLPIADRHLVSGGGGAAGGGAGVVVDLNGTMEAHRAAVTNSPDIMTMTSHTETETASDHGSGVGSEGNKASRRDHCRHPSIPSHTHTHSQHKKHLRVRFKEPESSHNYEPPSCSTSSTGALSDDPPLSPPMMDLEDSASSDDGVGVCGHGHGHGSHVTMRHGGLVPFKRLLLDEMPTEAGCRR
ncbi:unnamed protein product [Vitrella brassicaformis CCMP3155]|uniref:Uncharacterized protein n=3 Tax=Vitrella brassicaformis TaxID=1169539 RepID=A0A0G4EWR3_VITBC|nr:unnamed protein product [Vitrella brassicaformis CCMP3155]|eukprot:CEM02704.1 unnamed protein product [Vitrella brassicaformis CCMP3155]